MIRSNTIRNITPLDNSCLSCLSRKSCLAKILDEKELSCFSGLLLHRKPLRHGERLFNGGETFRSLFIVRSGSVKAIIESRDGEHQITGFYFPGDLIGLDGIESGYYKSSVEALDTSSFCEIPYEKVQEKSKNQPFLNQLITKYASLEIIRNQELILLLGRMNSVRKIAYFLIRISTILQVNGCAERNISLSMMRQDIANYLGLAIETVSRILTQFQHKKILTVNRRNVTIVDQERLAFIANNYSDDDKVLKESA